VLFEVYKKAVAELGNPCMMYTDIVLPYNSRLPNPQHFCPQCGNKVSLEVQITERVLSMENTANSRLLLMDFGSLLVFTCVGSCDGSTEECIVAQYEIDAITDEEIKKLEKQNKNKKKKERKKAKQHSKSK
jgi:hypothetical protein